MSRSMPVRPGDAAPDFTLSNSDGKAVTLSGLAGHPVLLCFVNFLTTSPDDLSDSLEQLRHYIDPRALSLVLVSDSTPTGLNLSPYFKTHVTDWTAAHPFLSKLWLVDTGKGFGDKIYARVMTRYGLFNSGAVLIDKNGKVAANLATVMDFSTGQLRLQSLGKTRAEDTVLKGPSVIDSLLAPAITALAAP